MSEEQELTPETEAATEGDVAVPQVTAGELLRQAREAAGLHVAALAVSMKVPVKKLEALEADRLDLLPDAVFVRALASSVCRTLKIDPAPVLALLPQTTAPQLRPDEWGINAPFRAPGDAATTSLRDQISRPGVLAALAILAAALVLIFFPSMERKEATSSEVVLATPTSANETTPVPAPTEKPADNPLPAPAAPALVEPLVVSPQVPPAPVMPPVVTTPAPPAPISAAVAAPQVGAPGSGVLGFKARGPSWVEVTDAQGVIQLRRTLATGETVSVSGALPLSVVIGRADVTEVQVRGKPFNLDAVVRENVARFEVK
ncbi:MAG: helix-turn-helix domain-containing protein [Burkholderiales bacterium]|nr:helix-turn-helix domain-containing protein [Burkholderiales bacterium]